IVSFAMLLSICVILCFNYTAPADVYTLSLHDALPISWLSIWRTSVTSNAPVGPWFESAIVSPRVSASPRSPPTMRISSRAAMPRSEEHTSELQSRENLVCRLLLEKKKQICSNHWNDHI